MCRLNCRRGDADVDDGIHILVMNELLLECEIGDDGDEDRIDLMLFRSLSLRPTSEVPFFAVVLQVTERLIRDISM